MFSLVGGLEWKTEKEGKKRKKGFTKHNRINSSRNLILLCCSTKRGDNLLCKRIKNSIDSVIEDKKLKTGMSREDRTNKMEETNKEEERWPDG